MGSKIKSVDPVYADLTADITVDASLKVPEKTCTVVGGDSLSKIAKHFYGDATKYMKIFEANKSQLTPHGTLPESNSLESALGSLLSGLGK